MHPRHASNARLSSSTVHEIDQVVTIMHETFFFPPKTPTNQRLSVNSHMKETLIQSLEDVARGVVKIGAEATGIGELQTIMTQAKEKVSAPSLLSADASPSCKPVPPLPDAPADV